MSVDDPDSYPESDRPRLDDEGGPDPTFLRRLHFIWFMLGGIVITIPLALIQVITHVFRPTARNFKRWSGLWGRMVLGFAGIRAHVVEEVRLDPEHPYIFLANHQNLLDILALAGRLRYPFGFVAKQELARVPALGLAIRHSASVFLDRSDPRSAVDSLRRAGEQIRKGMSVLMYPEGTRSYRPDLLPFKRGAFMLAVEAGVPVVPVVVVDGYRLMNEKRKASRPGRITIVVREPIVLTGMTRRDIPDLIERLEATMQEPLRQHRAERLSSAATARQDDVRFDR